MTKRWAWVGLVLVGCSSGEAIKADPAADGGPRKEVETTRRDPDVDAATPLPGAGDGGTDSGTLGPKTYTEPCLALDAGGGVFATHAFPGRSTIQLTKVIGLFHTPNNPAGFTHYVEGLFVAEGRVGVRCGSTSDQVTFVEPDSW